MSKFDMLKKLKGKALSFALAKSTICCKRGRMCRFSVPSLQFVAFWLYMRKILMPLLEMYMELRRKKRYNECKE